MTTQGFALAAAQLGLQSLLIKPRRSIGAIIAQVTVEESHHDEMVITDHPVEQGASIADHAFLRPAELTIKCGWSDSPTVPGLLAGLANTVTSTVKGVSALLSGNTPTQVKDMYAKLLKLQADREPFDVYTGKRVYKSMLIKSLSTVTDRSTANVLMITVVLQQVIIVTTQLVTVSAPAANQTSPQTTAPVVQAGVKQLTDGTKYNPQAGP